MSNTDKTYLQTDLQQYTNTQLLPQAVQSPIKSAVYKATATDFVVLEQMNVDFSEDGEHLWLQIEKVGVNTAHLSKELAKWAGIPQRDVGYSGIKDRHAVTTQWFSLRIPKKQLPSLEFVYQTLSNDPSTDNKDNNQEEVIVLQQHWHNKKLNRGTHKANHFIITLREVVGNKQAINNQLEAIEKQGVPNYFGEQRFGRNGNNLPQVLAWFNQVDKEKQTTQLETHLKTDELQNPQQPNSSNKNNKRTQNKRQSRKDRDIESILLSTARSVIFNQILAQRVKDGSWQTGLNGEVFNLAGTGSVFATEYIDEELTGRLAMMDIQPTAVLWGKVSENSIQPTSVAKAVETSTVENSTVLTKLAIGLEGMGLKPARRPLRLHIHQLSWQWQSEDVLQLSFDLPPGSFATSVLSTLIEP